MQRRFTARVGTILTLCGVVLPVTWLLLTAAAPQARVPSPEEFFGRDIGAPGVLIPHSRILDYYRVLEERSDRVEVAVVGETTGGRPFFYAVVTSPQNHARLEELMAMNDKLYDPHGVSEDEAERITREGKSFVIVNEQIHSTEVGGSQGGILLAYRMAAGDDPEVRHILDNVVFVHVPNHNPDGQEMVIEWLDRWRGTEHQNSSPPFLYQKYTGHDNNRDWYMFTQVETRHSIRMQNEFHPQFTLDQHQKGGGSRIFVPPFEDPWEPNIDPALIASNNLIGTFMGQYLVAHGLPGVEWKVGYDAWTPARAYYHYHGGVRILTEVASARYADPVEVPFESLGDEYRRPRWNFPAPWPGGSWRLEDIVTYHYTSAMAALRAAADLRENLLRGMYVAQRNSVQPPEGAPYAFVFPPDQPDPPTMEKLLEVLRIGDVEVEQAQASFTAAGRTYPQGTFVVRFAQPAGRFAKTVLERQEYPRLFQYPGGPLDPPYDVTAHTLPLLMNVDVDFIDAPFSADLAAAETPRAPPGGVVFPGTDALATPRAYLLDPRVNNSYAVAARLGGSGLSRATRPFTAAAREWPAGTFVVELPEAEGDALPVRQEVQEAGERFSVEVVAVPEVPEVPRQWVGEPRVAVYQSYDPSMPEGWFRFVLDSYEVPFDVIHYDDVRNGDIFLYGVIFLPPGGGGACTLVEGRDADCSAGGGGGGRGGGRGRPPTPPEYAGGIGQQGVAHLRTFVEEGGVLFTWSDAWTFLSEHMGVGAESVTRGRERTEFNIPGSILRVLVDTDNPLGYGLKDETPVFFRNDDAWPTGVPGSNVVARWPDSDLLMSGWIQGEEVLAGNAAMLEIPRGRGRMVMVGFSPEYRAQAHLTFKLMFNAIFYPRSDVGS